jgi:hypothetical protein
MTFQEPCMIWSLLELGGIAGLLLSEHHPEKAC